MAPEQPLTLSFGQGGLVLEGWHPSPADAELQVVYDPRTLQYRAPAYRYREIVLSLHQGTQNWQDQARAYSAFTETLKKELIPRPHQASALAAWVAAGKRGVVSLPTGAGKTILAVLAISTVARSTLVLVPTIDLMLQWQSVLASYFGCEVGLLGGGQRRVEALTVATYDSATLMIEQLGNQFGLLIADECHHLPAPQYQNSAYCSIAPYRLGLSATVERRDGGEKRLYELLGESVYVAQISDLAAQVLAPYEVVAVGVKLSPEERQRYELARNEYLQFVRRQGINFSQPDAWKQFIMRAARSPEGKKAFRAYREQKQLAQAAAAKLEAVWTILTSHACEPIIIFTDENAMAYHIGRTFMLPVLTHKTKAKERKDLLNSFRQGKLQALVTSKVLNEGVDVPEARVGVVVSGSGAVREHVQRLGRILRPFPGKRAVLYEVISLATSEQSVHERRRQHDAYQGPA